MKDCKKKKYTGFQEQVPLKTATDMTALLKGNNGFYFL